LPFADASAVMPPDCRRRDAAGYAPRRLRYCRAIAAIAAVIFAMPLTRLPQI